MTKVTKLIKRTIKDYQNVMTNKVYLLHVSTQNRMSILYSMVRKEKFSY